MLGQPGESVQRRRRVGRFPAKVTDTIAAYARAKRIDILSTAFVQPQYGRANRLTLFVDQHKRFTLVADGDSGDTPGIERVGNAAQGAAQRRPPIVSVLLKLTGGGGCHGIGRALLGQYLALAVKR